MPLTAQFKRNVVGIFESGKLRTRNPTEKAMAAVEMARINLVRNKYLTRASLTRPIEDMVETTKGKKVSQKKRADGSHSEKLRKFDKIWQMYLEGRAQEESEEPGVEL